MGVHDIKAWGSYGVGLAGLGLVTPTAYSLMGVTY